LKKVIFSINTGRSGSKYIASLCSGFANVASFHEPKPALCGLEMKRYQLGDSHAFDGLLELKMKKIRESLQKKDIYFESNHYFIKGFGWELMKQLKNEGVEIGIVVLNRDSNKIINSFYKIGTSLIGKGAENHLIHPQAKIAKEPFFKNAPIDWMKLSLMRGTTVIYNLPYYLGLRKRKSFSPFEGFQKEYLAWYIEQHYYLMEQFKNTYPELRYLEIDIEMDQAELLALMHTTFGMDGYHEHTIDKNKGEDYIKKAQKK